MSRQAQADSAGGEQERGERGLMAAAISNAVVRVHKQFYGKGPTKARTHLWENVLVVVLEGGLTRSEQTLRDRGRTQTVTSVRLALQAAIEPELRAAVESELHRQVRSVMSATDPHGGLEVLLFTLAPREPRKPDDRRCVGEWPDLDDAGTE